jgi:hypothetical protein
VGEAISTEISPDGRSLLYQLPAGDGRSELKIRHFDERELVPVPGSLGSVSWDLSPDGSEVAFVSDPGELFVTSGGLHLRIADSLTAWDHVHWGRDGFIYFRRFAEDASGPDALSRIPDTGGAVEPVTELEPGVGAHSFPFLAPGGDVLLFVVGSRPPRIDALRLSTGERNEVVPGTKAFLTPSGFMVFSTPEGNIMAAPFDSETLTLTAGAVTMVEDLDPYDTGVDPLWGLAEDGSLEFWPRGGRSDEWEFVWVDDRGQPSSVQPGWTFRSDPNYLSFDLAPDGRRIAWSEAGDEGYDIFIKDLPEGALRRLTPHEADDRYPRWTPDGQEITYQSTRDGGYTGWLRRADFTGQARRLVDFEGAFIEAFWTSDRAWTVLRTGNYELARDILGFRGVADSIPRPLLAVPEYDEIMPALSPDDRWIAYVSNSSGRRQVYVNPFPETGRPGEQISMEGGSQPRWGAEGRRLYYVSEGGSDAGGREMWVATVDPGPPLRVTGRELLFTLPAEFFFGDWLTTYNVVQDGAGGVRFLMVRAADGGEAEPRMHWVVRHWTEYLKEIEWR